MPDKPTATCNGKPATIIYMGRMDGVYHYTVKTDDPQAEVVIEYMSPGTCISVETYDQA